MPLVTVTGMTAAAMEAIRDNTIVDANVINDELIFTRYDNSTLNLGPVFDFSGGSHLVCTSSTRPATPFVGQQIYETDTGKSLVYYGGTSTWLQEWDKPWGRIGEVQGTSDVSIGTSVTTLMATPSITLRNDRIYQVAFHAALWSFGAANAMTIDIFFTENTTSRRHVTRHNQNQSDNLVPAAVFTYTPSATNTNIHRIRAQSSATGSTFIGATVPGQFTINDIGPNGNPPGA